MPIIRLKHQLSYIEKWRTEDDAEALLRGTLYHSVMEAHYRKLEDLRGDPGYVRGLAALGAPERAATVAQDLFLAVAPLLYQEKTGRQSERQELVEWIYRGYVDLYQTDRDWKVIEIEYPIEVWLPTERGGRSNIKLKGTVDLIVRDMSAGGGLWIVDHKTCKDLPSKDLDFEDQTGIYTYLLKRRGWDIRGAIYNFCRTRQLKRDMVAEERFKRMHTVRTDPELETLALEALETMREAYREYARMLREKGPDAVRPRTPDGERCGWKCGYTEPCIAGRKNPERLRGMLRETGFEQHETKPGPTFNKQR